eukprot:5076216-Amphidinium_carterae.1
MAVRVSSSPTFIVVIGSWFIYALADEPVDFACSRGAPCGCELLHQHGVVSPSLDGNAPPPSCSSPCSKEDQPSSWTFFPWNWQWWSTQNSSVVRQAAQCGVCDDAAQQNLYLYYYQYFYGGNEYNHHGDYGGYYDEYEYAADEPSDVCAI